MKRTKKAYQKPTITRVEFKDKALVSFATCRKALGEPAGCLQGAFQTLNLTVPDPS